MRYQKIKIIVTAALFTLSILMVNGCRYDKAEILNPPIHAPVNCATSPAKFSSDILPLITSKCATPNCHDTEVSGGLVLKTYAEISAAKDRIYERAVVEKSMPQSGPLPPAAIDLLKCWINNGAQNN